VNNLENTSLGVMIATPCYGGQLTLAYLNGILNTISVSNKYKFKINLNTIGNESLITRARNTLVSQFLDMDEQKHNELTHLMFIDSDIGFNGEAVWRLLNSSHDIVCGIYPQKSIDWNLANSLIAKGDLNSLEQKVLKYNLNFKNPSNIKVVNGFTEVLEAATGFMCIKKEVFYKMKEAYPELKYSSDQTINNKRFSSNNCYAFFDCIIDEKSKRYLPEDYTFCRRWQKIGGKIYADVSSPLTHYGTYAFKGNIKNKFFE